MNLVGNLNEISLPQLIENICHQNQTGCLRIKYLQQTGILSFQNGELVDAEFGGDASPEAVYLSLSLPADAFYEFEPGILASRRTINEPWQRVVLRGFCRLKKDTATIGESTADKGGPTVKQEKPPLQSLRVPPPPPPLLPRQYLPIKSSIVASVGMIVVVLVIGTVVVIASYLGGRGEKKSSEAHPSLITQGSVVPVVSPAPDAGIPRSPQVTESALRQPVAGASMAQAANELRPTPAPEDYSTREVTTEDWFVILQVFPKRESDKAAQSSIHLRSLGHDTRVVDTDSYPNFRGGMWAVIMGPYSHGTATEVVRDLRPLIPDVYTKPGKASSLRE